MDLSGQDSYVEIPFSDEFKWYHVAATYDSKSKRGGTATLLSMYGEKAELQWTNGVRIYINGKLSLGPGVYEAARASKSKIAAPPPEGIVIGHNYGQKGRFFEGAIDEVVIYNRALSDEEIEALCQAALGRRRKP